MSVLISYDMNGPLARTDTSELVPHDGIVEAIDSLPFDDDDVEIVLNSGYDIDTLRHFRDDILDQPDMHLIGELGSVYETDGELEQVFPGEPEEDMLDIKQRLYTQAAEEGRKIHEQGNYSTIVGCTRVEGEGTPDDPRGEVYKHHAVDPATTTEDIWQDLRDESTVEYDGDRIMFDPDDIDAVKAVADTLRYDHTFTGVRFEEADDGVAFYRDREDADIDIEEAHDFMERVIEPTDWDYEHNPEWGSDYMKDIDSSKQNGAYTLARELFDGPFTVVHVGDKPSDVMNGASEFYALEGTEAEAYADEHDIPYETVEDGVAFTEEMIERL